LYYIQLSDKIFAACTTMKQVSYFFSSLRRKASFTKTAIIAETDLSSMSEYLATFLNVSLSSVVAVLTFFILTGNIAPPSVTQYNTVCYALSRKLFLVIFIICKNFSQPLFMHFWCYIFAPATNKICFVL
jgi:hypothetical protein